VVVAVVVAVVVTVVVGVKVPVRVPVVVTVDVGLLVAVVVTVVVKSRQRRNDCEQSVPETNGRHCAVARFLQGPWLPAWHPSHNSTATLHRRNDAGQV